MENLLYPLTKLLVYCWMGVIVGYFFSHTVLLVYGGNNLSDYVFMHNPNDSLISTYYLIWMQIQNIGWFVFILFLFINYLHSNYLTHRFWYQIIILLLTSITHYAELTDYTSLNSINRILITSDSYVNNLLTNHLNRYHPFLFYTATAYIINCISLFYIFRQRNFNASFLNASQTTFYTYSYQTVLLICTSLYLGAWWSFQEGNWGGWWNSDSSEMLGLFVLMLSLFNIHRNLTRSGYNTQKTNSAKAVLSFLFFYYFLQINYKLTSHNFDIRFFFFLNSNIFFEVMLAYLIVLAKKLLSTCYSSEVRLWQACATTRNGSNKFYTNSTSMLIYLFFIWSFGSVISLVDVSVFSYRHELGYWIESNYYYLTVLFNLYFILVLFSFNITNLTTGLLLITVNTLSYSHLLIYSWIFFKYSKFTHWLLSLFLFINLTSSDLVFLYFHVNPLTCSTTLHETSHFTHFLMYTCDSSSFYRNIWISNSLFQNFNIWTPVVVDNLHKIDKALLLFDNNTSVEYLYHIYDFSIIRIILENSEITTLNCIWVLILSLLLYRSSL